MSIKVLYVTLYHMNKIKEIFYSETITLFNLSEIITLFKIDRF